MDSRNRTNMSTLTKESAKQHCRICLIKIHLEENDVNTKTVNSQGTETKDIVINIIANKKLHLLYCKYITEEKFEEYMDISPQNVCVNCFEKLQEVDHFLTQARQNAEVLYTLLINSTEEKSLDDNDMYKLLLKDSLMETETVLLDTAQPRHIDEEINNPDPFSTNTGLTKDGENDGWETTDSSNEDNEWEASSVTSSLSECKPVTRSKSRNIVEETRNMVKTTIKQKTEKENKFSVTYPAKEKKKRRTKKEMEAFRREQVDKVNDTENGEHKIKRRKKGTKNNFKCARCNHCFAHKITLDAHVRKVHEGQLRPYQCDRCEKSYTFIGGLYTHIKEIHDVEERSHACNLCPRTYTSFIAMQKHKRLKHTQEGDIKKYVCEQCGATFNQSCNLRYHRRSRHPTDDEKAEKANAELYECEICKKFFHTRYTLKYHTMQLHSNEMKYECNICHRKMAKKFMLAQHMLVHSTDKTPCEHCGKQFIRKFELEAHVRAVHMKLKPFECKYCAESFASRKTLRHHEYIHTGEKPYVCNICGQAYRQPTCLKNHRKTHEKTVGPSNSNAVLKNEPENKQENTRKIIESVI